MEFRNRYRCRRDPVRLPRGWAPLQLQNGKPHYPPSTLSRAGTLALLYFILCGLNFLHAEEMPVEKPSISVGLIQDLPIPFFPVLEATVEGRLGRFLVDTGAPTTLLTPAFSDAVGLDRTVREGSIRAGDASEVPAENTVETVDLPGIYLTGDFRLGPVRAYLHNLDPLNRLLDSPVAGIIGMDLLGQYILRFNFPEHRLEFNPRDISGIPVRALWRENRVYVKVLLEGFPVPFIVDTASRRTMVDPSVWKRLSADKKIFSEERMTVSVSGAKMDEKFFLVVENFDLAPLLLKQATVMSGSRNVLGLSVLERFSVTFIPEKNTVVFSNPQIEKALHAAPAEPSP